MTARDYLARKGLQPLVIVRTKKRRGDLVLVNSTAPALEVRGGKMVTR